MVVEDRNGDIHDKSNGWYTKKGSGAKSGSIRPGEGERAPWAEEEPASAFDINSVTEEINSNPGNAERIIRQAIADGKLNTKLFSGAQNKHILGTKNYKQEIEQGREPSILTADAKDLIKRYAGKGVPVMTRKNKWAQCESFTHTEYIGIYKNNKFGSSHKTHKGRMHYSNNGIHIVPDQEEKYDKFK